MRALSPTPGFYPGSNQARLLNANDQQFLLQNQAGSAGKSSIAVQLERQKSAFYPFGSSFEISFSGDPGTFEVDVQDADTDVDTNYVSVGQVVQVNASFVGRIELPQLYTKYTRVNVVTLTNAVNITVLVTR